MEINRARKKRKMRKPDPKPQTHYNLAQGFFSSEAFDRVEDFYAR